MVASGILAVAMLVFGVATNYPVVLVSYVAWGSAFTFRVGADSALLYDTLKQVGREAELPAIHGRSWALRSAAGLLGLLLGAPIAAATRYSFTFTFSAPCSPAHCRSRSGCTNRLERSRSGMSRTTLLRVRLDRLLGAAVRSLRLRRLGRRGAGFGGPGRPASQPWLAEHGVATAQPSACGRRRFVASGCRRSAGGWLLRDGGTDRLLRAARVAGRVLCALAGFGEAPVAVAFLGIGVVRGLHDPFLSDYVNRQVDSERRATVLSVQNVAGNLVMASVWPLAGVVSDALGLSAVFAMYACGTLLLGVGAICLWSRAERALNAGRLT